jgi:hypothetical protein
MLLRLTAMQRRARSAAFDMHRRPSSREWINVSALEAVVDCLDGLTLAGKLGSPPAHVDTLVRCSAIDLAPDYEQCIDATRPRWCDVQPHQVEEAFARNCRTSPPCHSASGLTRRTGAPVFGSRSVQARFQVTRPQKSFRAALRRTD